MRVIHKYMRLNLFTLFIVVLLLKTIPAFTQTGAPPIGSISGILVDSKNSPVSYANVTLLRSDSSVVNGDLSKDDGSFSIATNPGSFRLRIEFVGLATKYVTVQVTADQPDKKLGKIKLAQTENTLGEVDVVSEKAVMELKVDKKVFNVEKNTTTAGGNATDVLQNVPSVSVDADGNVSLRGKTDVTILIDGKPSTLLGTDVASALQSLPANSIESVEVLTNPSAKYDAQGTSGIINIITKKDGRFGMNGNLTLGAGTNDKYNGNLGLNVRKGKWSAFLNSSFRLNSTYNNVTTDRTNKVADSLGAFQSYHTYEHVPRHFDGNFNSIGASYDPDKYNSFTLTENINLMQFGFKDSSNYSIYNNPNESGTPVYHQARYSNFYGGPFSLSTALDYKHKFKKKDEELSVDVTYANTVMRRQQDYYTGSDSLNADGTIRNQVNTTEHAPGTGGNNTFTAWADYTDPLFTKNGKLGLGVKTQIYNFSSSNNPIIDTLGVNNLPYPTDYSLLSNYNYTQDIHAAYVNWSDQLGKFAYQAGLRAEDAIYNGTGQLANVTRKDTSFQNSFVNLFPSAFVSYQLPDQQSIYLNYSRRTNRPGFRQLIPFVDLSNPGTVNVGNPALIPEFINNLEFSYSKADKKSNNFILSAYYAYTENLIQSVPIPLDSTDAFKYPTVPKGSLITIPQNIESGVTYGAEGTGHFQLLPIWDATINLNYFENQLTIGNNINSAYKQYLTNTSGTAWFGKVNTNLKLPKNFSFQVNANYESPKVIASGTLRQTWWMDVALRKNFWKNKATLIVNCSDIFKTHVYVTDYKLSSYTETIDRVRETRIGNITFTYRFGKTDANKGNGKRGKGMDDKTKPPMPGDEERDNNLKDKNDDGGGGQGGGAGGPGGGGGGGQKNGGGGNGIGH